MPTVREVEALMATCSKENRDAADRRQCPEVADLCRSWLEQHHQLADRDRQIAELREALGPFAVRIAGNELFETMKYWPRFTTIYEDLRRAKAVYERTGGK